MRHFVHREGLLLPHLPAALGPDRFRHGKPRGGVQPADHDFVSGERRGLAREIGENHLRDVLRQGRVAPRLAQRGRVNKIDVPPHELAKRLFRFLLDVAAQKFGVILHAGFSLTPAAPKTAQKIQLRCSLPSASPSPPPRLL